MVGFLEAKLEAAAVGEVDSAASTLGPAPFSTSCKKKNKGMNFRSRLPRKTITIFQRFDESINLYHISGLLPPRLI
jgi:hypothetical protein